MRVNILLFLPDDFDSNQVPNLEDYYQFVIVREKELREKEPDSYAYVSLLERETKAMSWLTIGDVDWNKYLSRFSFHSRKRWVHRDNFSGWSMNELSFCYFVSSFGHGGDEMHPLISVYTTTFHSGDKILRPYESLQAQTYKNWEWIIWDDSKDEKTYHELLELQKKDIRIQVYRAPQHSGYIGEMKRRCCGVARGKWLVEIDHDDRISPILLERIVQVDKEHPETDFIYSEYALVREDTLTDTDYGGDYYGFGYGGFINQWSSDGKTERYYLLLTTPTINPRTTRYIVGVPNHVRVWKRSFYQKIHEYNPNLPVVDDYELLLRTFLESKNWVRLADCLYFQYQNSGGNNFTYHRNRLIQYITQWSAYLYESKIHKRFEELGWKDEMHEGEVCWKRNRFEYPYFGILDDPFSKSLTIIIPVDIDSSSIGNGPDALKNTLQSIFEQNSNNWKVYLIGNQCHELENVVGWIVSQHRKYVRQVDWWNMREKSPEYTLLNYILKTCVTNADLKRYVSYMKPGMLMDKDFIAKWDTNKEGVREMSGRKGIFGLIHPMKMLEHSLWDENSDLYNLDKK